MNSLSRTALLFFMRRCEAGLLFYQDSLTAQRGDERNRDYILMRIYFFTATSRQHGNEDKYREVFFIYEMNVSVNGAPALIMVVIGYTDILYSKIFIYFQAK